MIVGVGYSVVTDVLDITGSADVNHSAAEEAFNVDIHFSDVVVVGNAGDGDTASRNADNVDKASFTVNSLQGKDDTATFTFTIVNDGDLAATVTPTLSANLGNTNPEYFSITSDWNGQPKILAAGAELTYTVTVKLVKTPTETIAGSFLIELTAVADDS